MGDEDHGLALLLEASHNLEELLHFEGGQVRGRFVKDEHVGSAIEDFEDFHPLLDACGEELDGGVKGHGKAGFLGQGLEPLAGFVYIQQG